MFVHFFKSPLQKSRVSGFPPHEPLNGLFLNMTPIESPRMDRPKIQIVKTVTIFQINTNYDFFQWK